MRSYLKMLFSSVMIMLVTIGVYSLVFSKKALTVPVFSEALGSSNFDDINSLTEYEKDRFTASVLDAVIGDGFYIAKTALAGVILNRTAENGFSDSYVAAVFSDPQMKEVLEHDFSVAPSTESLSAVKDARLGLSPCKNALWFYKKEAASSFLLRKNILYQSGNFVFAE